MTAPLPDRLRQAAETVEQLNAMCNFPVDTPIFPSYLRAEAKRLEKNE